MSVVALCAEYVQIEIQVIMYMNNIKLSSHWYIYKVCKSQAETRTHLQDMSADIWWYEHIEILLKS